MFRDFVINAGMLVAFISVCYQIFGNTGLNPQLSLRLKLRSGLIFGIMGIILVEFSVKLANHLILDLRILPILIASLYGGFLPGLITGLATAMFRMFRFGVSFASIFASVSMLSIPFFNYVIFKKQKTLHKKWIYSLLVSEFVTGTSYALFVPELSDKIVIILIYLSVTSLVAFVLYKYIGYLEAYTFAFRRYKLEAKRDFLTGLNNVRQFDTVYNNVVDTAKQLDQKFSLLFLDIDFFKKVNDTYGHKEGDVVLKTLGEILLQNCRDGDIVSRNGGEEFSIILPNCDSGLALDIAERIRQKVQNTPFVLSDGTSIKITISIGAACYPDKIEDLNTMKEKADEALYSAKRSGRNKVVLAEQ